jgi:hypothetical protein
MRLKIQLIEDWKQVANTEGPATFLRGGSSNAFQVSWAEFKGATPANISGENLKEMSIQLGENNNWGTLLESMIGTCTFGAYATAIFRSSSHPRLQVWCLTDGGNCIIATHVCDNEPSPEELHEVKQMAINLSLGPEIAKKPKWKFW